MVTSFSIGEKMTRAIRTSDARQRGSVLVLSLIFIVMFSALAVGMASVSGTNVQVARNQREVGRALASAYSGLEVMRYYMRNVNIPASVAPASRVEFVTSSLQTAFTAANLGNICASYNSGTQTLTIPSVTLHTQSNQSFTATLTYDGDYDTVNLIITGQGSDVSKRVGVQYQFATIGNPIFDFGIATKGPLNMQGNVDIDGYNENIEASVYIESSNDVLALEMTGKSAIAGEVSIANGAACVDIGNSSSVCGATGSDAMDHVTIGADMCDFPIANPADFIGYVENVFGPNDPTSNVTLTNIEIPANTNPSFSGHAIIQGVMYVRVPNVVSFTGNAEIHGLIVAEGDVDNPVEGCLIDFGGTVESYDVSTLSEEDFGELTQETGTFLLAPGFSVCFRGNFDTLNGVIAASGIEFNGNAGGTINGSVINFSDECMTLSGNTDLVFNRSGVQEVPAGFEPSTTLQFVPDSYWEPTL